MGVLAVCQLQAASGFQEDSVVNTFAFDADYDGTAVTSIVENLDDFYNTVGTSGHRVAHYLSGSLSRAVNSIIVNLFDLAGHLDGTPLGSPQDTDAITLAAAGTESPLPAEVAIALSYHADLTGLAETVPAGVPGPAGDQRPRSRHRGRIFVGPLNIAALEGTAPDWRARVHVDCRNAIADAAFRLFDTSGPGGAGNWCVWSRKNAALYPIVGGHVDDAFDTMRKRGEQAVNRTNW